MEFVTSGAWGPGNGGNLLPAATIDANFWELREDVDDLVANPPDANGIASIQLQGLAWVITLTDSTVLPPVPIPVVMPRWRGDWQATTFYSEMDMAVEQATGIFLVLNPHTSEATFDPDAVGAAVTAGSFEPGSVYVIETVGTTDFVSIGASANTPGVIFTATAVGSGTGTATPKFYLQLWGFGTGVIGLDTLSDVDLTGAAEGDVLTLVGDTWEPRSPFTGAEPVGTITGATYTLLIGDANAYRRASHSSAIAWTIPTNASVAFPIGTTVAIEQVDAAAAVTIAGAVGVTLNCHAALTPITNGQFAVAQIKKVGTDMWTIFGNLVPA